jgi:hypothetical protein
MGSSVFITLFGMKGAKTKGFDTPSLLLKGKVG